ncbi:MAG: PD-(D/E)XK nuclease family protein [Desulfovibrionaceae bacterium]|nr:PD-(D/E)XK nuclease family protein [Desulfovibrionaceae bacterium]
MTMSYPVTIVPWNQDFIEALYHGILHSLKHDHKNPLIVFPHSRPKRYLENLFLKQKLPCVLPEMLTIREFFSCWNRNSGFRREIGEIERIELLYDIVSSLKQQADLFFNAEESSSFEQFFPWGQHLASLLEECFMQYVCPENISYTEELVQKFGANLLQSLRDIFQEYVRRLRDLHLTTPGLNAFTVAEELQQPQDIFQIPLFLQNRTVFLAGHAVLTKSERLLFQFLCDRLRAQEWIHCDPALANGGSHHWSCDIYGGDRLRGSALRVFSVTPSLLSTRPAQQKNSTNRTFFFEGPDFHSQLCQLRRDLKKDPEKSLPGTAIILPDSSLLLPVLHAIQDHVSPNISLGYPLSRSLIFSLLENILRVHEERLPDPDGRIPWKTVLDLLRHPFCKMLTRGNDIQLGTLFTKMEEIIETEGIPFVDITVLLHNAQEDIFRTSTSFNENAKRQQLIRLSGEWKKYFFDQWHNLSNLQDMGTVLQSLYDFLLSFNASSDEEFSLWDRYPQEAECLFRLHQRIIPELKGCRPDYRLSHSALFAITRSMLAQERVSFQNDSLERLQIIGMLEARLLHFSRIFILEATDDLIPSFPSPNPLLPELLRKVLHLPDSSLREELAAYNFYRLLAGADEVNLYWQKHIASNSLESEGKIPSRFISLLLWEREKNNILSSNNKAGIFSSTNNSIRLPQNAIGSIEKNKGIKSALNSYLQHPVSFTALSTYIQCPLQFWYRYVCCLDTAKSVAAQDLDLQGEIGSFMHRFLHDAALKQQSLGADKHPDPQTIEKWFLQHLENDALSKKLSTESLLVLKHAAPSQLCHCLADLGSSCFLEKTCTAKLDCYGGLSVSIKGQIDRIDIHTGRDPATASIIDYKTGNKSSTEKQIRELQDLLSPSWNPDFWHQLNEVFDESNRNQPVPDALFHDLHPHFGKIWQLLCYAWLYDQQQEFQDHPLDNASFLYLGTREKNIEKQKIRLFAPELSLETKLSFIRRNIANLLRYVFRHMRENSVFSGREDDFCHYCLYRNLCIMLARD